MISYKNVSADSSGRRAESIFVLEHTLQPELRGLGGGWSPIRHHSNGSETSPKTRLPSLSGSSELGTDLHKWLDLMRRLGWIHQGNYRPGNVEIVRECDDDDCDDTNTRDRGQWPGDIFGC